MAKASIRQYQKPSTRRFEGLSGREFVNKFNSVGYDYHEFWQILRMPRQMMCSVRSRAEPMRKPMR